MKRSDGFIDPTRLYNRQTALRAVGLGLSTLRKARSAGIELETFKVGKVLLAHGGSVIHFLEKIAAHQKQQEEQAAHDAAEGEL